MALSHYPSDLGTPVFGSLVQGWHMQKPITHFRRTNCSGYSCFVKGCGPLMVWFAPEMSWFAAPNGNAGHPERVPAVAIRD